MNNVFLQEDTPAKTLGDYKIRCYDPYGFWRFENEDEGDITDVPQPLKGWFTSLKLAMDTYDATMTAPAEATKATKSTVKRKPKDLINTVRDNSNILA